MPGGPSSQSWDPKLQLELRMWNGLGMETFVQFINVWKLVPVAGPRNLLAPDASGLLKGDSDCQIGNVSRGS